ncbi:MAG: zinc ribbon domain-containing protein [Candidatus Bathyarchaeia archaeon]|jgi:hypothetical protein
MVSVLILVVATAAFAGLTQPLLVYAQEPVRTTAISNLSYPSEVTISGSSVSAQVSLTVSYNNGPIGPGYELGINIEDIDQSSYLNGSVVSSGPRIPCVQGWNYPYSAFCFIHMDTPSGYESVVFAVIFTSARVYHLRAFAMMATTNGEGMPNTLSHSEFTITVVSGAQESTTYTPYTYFSTPSAVTSTPSLQMPQPPQQMSTQSTNNTQQLVLALAAIAAVVIGAAFLYSRRKGRTVKKAEKVETAVAPSSTKTAEGKRSCIECGNELPPNLKFCDSCGTKQP